MEVRSKSPKSAIVYGVIVVIGILLSISLLGIFPAYHRPFISLYGVLTYGTYVFFTTGINVSMFSPSKRWMSIFAVVILINILFNALQPNLRDALLDPFSGALLTSSLMALLLLLRLQAPQSKHSQNIQAILFTILIIGGFIFTAIIHIPYLLVDYSLIRSHKHDLKGAHNALVLAMKIDSTNKYAHNAFARVNIAIAQQLAEAGSSHELILTHLNTAKNEANTLIRHDPQDPAHWGLLGDVYKQMLFSVNEAPLWAIATYERSIALAPHDPQYLIKLASIYMLTKKPEQAIPLLNQALHLDPNNKEILHLHNIASQSTKTFE